MYSPYSTIFESGCHPFHYPQTKEKERKFRFLSLFDSKLVSTQSYIQDHHENEAHHET